MATRTCRINNKGFTLVEMIIYVGIFAIILTVIVRLFLQVQESELRSRRSREVKENAAQIVEILRDQLRNADSVDAASSSFLNNAGSLTFLDSGITRTIEAYDKQITIAGQSVTIQKLRFTEPGSADVDMTSDHVDVERFYLTNLTQSGSPASMQLDLQIDAINPENDPNYSQSITLRTNFTLRDEIE